MTDKRKPTTSPVVPATVSEETLQRNADRITTLYHKMLVRTVTDLVRIGRALKRMQEQTPYGAFERMFKDHAAPVAHPIPFTHRHGDSLMAIAAHPITSDLQYADRLPWAIGTLRELVRLPASAFLRALEDGRINPQMERAAALALLGRVSVPRAPTRQALAESESRRLTRLVATLHHAWMEFPDLRDRYVAEVEALARAAGLTFPSASSALDAVVARTKLLTPDQARQTFKGLEETP
jgi:hypothetical protein